MFMDFQIDYLLYLQNLREMTADVLTPFFLLMTQFGEYLLPFSVFAVIYWCVDKRIGAFLILNCGFSMMINLLIKNAVCLYRPWVVDARVKPVEAALKYAGGYSFPSGHTTIAVSCWGAIGVFWRKIRGLLLLMLFLCVMIGLSRNYVGVHTLQDVVAAAVVAVVLLVLNWRIFCWMEKGKKRDLFVALIVILFCILLSVYICYKAYPQDYLNGVLFVDVNKCRLEVFSKLGFVVGGFCGYLLERRFVNFALLCHSLLQKVQCALCGLIPLFVFLWVMSIFCKWLFEMQCACFCGLFVISFYITFIYPFILSRLGVYK